MSSFASLSYGAALLPPRVFNWMKETSRLLLERWQRDASDENKSLVSRFSEDVEEFMRGLKFAGKDFPLTREFPYTQKSHVLRMYAELSPEALSLLSLARYQEYRAMMEPFYVQKKPPYTDEDRARVISPEQRETIIAVVKDVLAREEFLADRYRDEWRR